MSLLRRLTFSFLTMAFITVGSTAFAAEETQKPAQLRVSATVLPHIWSTLEREPDSLIITEEDRRRGVVTVTGVGLKVQTNDPSGYMVLFRLQGAEVESMRVEGLSQEVVVTDGRGFVLQPFVGTAAATSRLAYRLTLRQDVVAGTYRWPVSTETRRISGMP